MKATHLLIGESDTSAGIIAQATDELSAFKIKKKCKAEGYTKLKIVLNDIDGIQEASEMMQSFIKRKWL
jgi:hypothetical protein